MWGWLVPARALCDAARMFDAVVIAGADPEPAARTLAGLVEGVVDGMARRVVLASLADTDALRRLADAAGCRLALGVPQGGFGAALREHLEAAHALAFTAGALLPAGWPEILTQELRRRGPPGADAGLAFRPAGLGARLALLAAAKGRRLPLAYGVLAPRAALTGGGFDGAAVRVRHGALAAHLTTARFGR